ncbi:MAG: class I mannose-6-phosphate isomerase [Sphingobium sp.]
MSARRLPTKYLDKPWGRDVLPPLFPHANGKRIGEIWFEEETDETPELLVKYLFTGERLSIQVHPDDVEGRKRGLPGGKAECWYILDCEPDSRLGIGTLEPLTPERLRAAALDGSIEGLMNWRPVRPGDFLFVPAGTIHAIGAGISLVEVQQNVDITYRLYDYGRPRELHLEDGVAVSRAEPYAQVTPNLAAVQEADLLGEGDHPFALSLRSFGDGDTAHVGAQDGPGWFVPLTGGGSLDGQHWQAGECWLLDGPVHLTASEPSRALIATLR